MRIYIIYVEDCSRIWIGKRGAGQHYMPNRAVTEMHRQLPSSFTHLQKSIRIARQRLRC